MRRPPLEVGIPGQSVGTGNVEGFAHCLGVDRLLEDRHYPDRLDVNQVAGAVAIFVKDTPIARLRQIWAVRTTQVLLKGP